MQASKTPALEGSSSFYMPYQGMFSKGKINNNKKTVKVFLLDLVLSSEYLSSLHLDLRGTQACPWPHTKCFPVVLVIFKQYSWPLSSRRPPTFREKTITCKCSVWSRTMPEDSTYCIIWYWLNVWWCLFQVKICSLYLINCILLM